MIMVEDYFDRVCRLPGTKLVAKSLKVESLWKKRLDRLTPHKAERLKQLCNALFQLFSEYNKTGKPPERPHMTAYWDYVKGYQPRWLGKVADSGRRYMNDKMRHALRLFDSIKAEGINEPLCMITEGDRTYLYRGYHRLVAAKVLGIDKVQVSHATVSGDSGSE